MLPRNRPTGPATRWQHRLMTMRLVSIEDYAPGELWLGSMPGRFERFTEFEAEARRRKLG